MLTDRSAPALEQQLTGLNVGVVGHVVCARCKNHVSEGEPVEAYAYKLADDDRWSVPRVICDECCWGALIETLGATEALVEARVGRLDDQAEQTQRAVLVAPDVTRVSPPSEGSPP